MTAAVRPAYYNEWDPYCAAWLRNLVAAGHIAPGGLPGPVTAQKRRSPVTAFAGRARGMVDGDQTMTEETKTNEELVDEFRETIREFDRASYLDKSALVPELNAARAAVLARMMNVAANASKSINKEERELSARRRLAKRLFEAEEFLDPSNTGAWEGLSERERSYYEALIGELLVEKTDLCLALEVS